jgi:CRISPR-associated protein Csx17
MASFPFLLGATSVGDIAIGDIERTGKEIWLPLWDRPTSIYEIRELFTSGRIEVHNRIAVNGIDAVQAISQLGVDRGVRAFRRIGLFKGRTGGDKYLSAIDMGSFPVRRWQRVDLLSDIDIWLSSFRKGATSKNAPTSIGRSLRNLNRAIFSMSTDHASSRVQNVLISLGACERSIAKSFKWAKESFVRPVPALSERWLREADDGSPEFRLAASLASVYGHYSDHDGKPIVMPIRAQMEPVHTWLIDGHLSVAFNEDQSRDLAWSDGDPLSAMNQIMARRIMRAVQSGSRLYPDRGRLNANLGDIADFIEDRINIRHMVNLLWGLILVDWPSVSKDAITRCQTFDSIAPEAGYGMLKLCFAGETVRGVEISIVPEIHRRATLGDSYNSIRLAEHRLRGSGLPTNAKSIWISPRMTKRTAAALLFPISRYQIDALADNVLRPDHNESENKMVNECE